MHAASVITVTLYRNNPRVITPRTLSSDPQLPMLEVARRGTITSMKHARRTITSMNHTPTRSNNTPALRARVGPLLVAVRLHQLIEPQPGVILE